MKLHAVLAGCALVLWRVNVAAQELPPTQAPPPAAPTGDPWEFSGNAFWSDPPGSDDRLALVFKADRATLHLEGRYNYEDHDTASFFVGRNHAFGEELSVVLTPMIGAVVGDTDGIAPGLEADLGWKRLSWYTEAEYLFDTDDSDDNYLYSWSTLLFAFNESWSAGLVTERSKIVDTDYSVQRGLAVELTTRHVGFALYAYNLDESDDRYAVVSLTLTP